MRRIALLATLLLVGCAPVRADDDDSCVTALRICAHWGSIDDPVDDGSASVQTDDGDVLESPLGADGCVAFDVGEGLWEWRASNGFGDCVSAWETTAVDSCSTVSREVDLTQWCMDGDGDPLGR